MNSDTRWWIELSTLSLRYQNKLLRVCV